MNLVALTLIDADPQVREAATLELITRHHGTSCPSARRDNAPPTARGALGRPSAAATSP